jgi:hypothetical protein
MVTKSISMYFLTWKVLYGVVTFTDDVQSIWCIFSASNLNQTEQQRDCENIGRFGGV